MNQQKILELLTAIQQGRTTPEEGASRLARLPFEDLGFAKLDHHRSLRTGRPEVIYAAGKTIPQLVEIFTAMARQDGNVLATRASPEAGTAVIATFPEAVYHPAARAITLRRQPPRALPGKIALLCAGTADLPVAEEAAVTAELFGATLIRLTDVGVAGLHRLLTHQSVLREATVIIVCAGMDGALPSVVAGLTAAPVIAVPTSVGYGASFGGLAALLTMLNACSPNVAVVNIDNGFGAACFATSLLELGTPGTPAAVRADAPAGK